MGKGPFENFWMAKPVMSTSAGGVVEKAYSEQHPDFGTPKTPPMCSGPYELVSWKSGSKIVLERNDSYWAGTKAKYGKSLLTFYLIPTHKDGPLQDPRIRKALFLALNRTPSPRRPSPGPPRRRAPWSRRRRTAT